VSREELHVVWSGTVGYAGRYHQWSRDGGQTWSATEKLPGVEQSFGSGFTEGVVDSNGVLHLFTGITNMSFLSWYAGEWTLLQSVWDVDYSYGDPVIEGGMPRMVLLNGNRLIALWHDNWRIFFATKLIDVEPVTYSAPLICSKPSLSETDIEIVADDDIPAVPYDDLSPLQEERIVSATRPLVIGILPVIVIVLLVYLFRSNVSRGTKRWG
jgi:hypothetical protein